MIARLAAAGQRPVASQRWHNSVSRRLHNPGSRRNSDGPTPSTPRALFLHIRAKRCATGSGVIARRPPCGRSSQGAPPLQPAASRLFGHVAQSLALAVGDRSKLNEPGFCHLPLGPCVEISSRSLQLRHDISTPKPAALLLAARVASPCPSCRGGLWPRPSHLARPRESLRGAFTALPAEPAG